MKTERLTKNLHTMGFDNYTSDILEQGGSQKDNEERYKKSCKIVNKLGQKEDDDEKLGIDSHILFQALKQKEVYVIKEHPVTKEKKIVKAKFQLDLFYNAFNKFHCSLWFEELGMDVPAKFYGTDWALTREELEK